MDAILKFNGPSRSLMLQLYTRSHTAALNKDQTINFNDPWWHIQWREKRTVSYWLDSAIDLCKTDITHDLFGCGLADLLAMSVEEFTKLSNTIAKIREARERAKEDPPK